MKPGIIAVLAVAAIHIGHPRLANIAQSRIVAAPSSVSHPHAGTNVRIAEAYGRQPLGFEANHGQAGAAVHDVQFVSRGAGYTLFLTSTEAVLALRSAPPDKNERAPTTLLRMKMVDSNVAPRVSQDDELPGKSNYIIGSDRRNWYTEVPRYGKVKYHDVYPGVALVYYGNQQQLEYDFIVDPGADPDLIELAFDGAQDIQVNDAGDLLLATGGGEVRLKTPLIYQETDGRRVQIPGGYRKTAGDRVAFDVGEYDSAKTLVIDPILVYSTYLGGSSQDVALGIAADPNGAAYITGYATSVNFPTSGVLQPECATIATDGFPYCEDAFITKLSPNGTLEYSTYLGGTFGDMATGIALRPDAGGVYITGWTRSPDFPTVNAVEPAFNGDPSTHERAFVAKLNAEGSELLYSTYLGGDDPSVRANGIAVDLEGSAYVTGSVGSPYSPSDVFITKLTPEGSALAYSVRFGGLADDVAHGIAVDGQGHASVTGRTDSPDFPRVNSDRPPSGGFAAKLFPDGSEFVYSAYVRGVGTGLTIAGPDTYVTGVIPGFQHPGGSPAVGAGGGSTDAFVEILDFAGRPRFGTHLGGTGDDRGAAIGIDGTGNVWVTGVTTSTDFPLVNPLQGQVHDLDAFVVKLNNRLEPVFSTYLGGGGREQLMSEIGILPGPPGPALAVERPGFAPFLGRAAYVAGFTDSTDFPTSGLIPAAQPNTNGPINGFVAVLVDDGVPTRPDLVVTEISGTPVEAEVGATLGYLLEVTNNGPAAATNVMLTDQLPPGAVVSAGQGAVVVWPPFPGRSCVHDATLVSCTLGALSQADTVIVAILVTATTSGTLIHTATVSSDAADGNVDDNTATTTTLVTPGSADVAVTGSASSDLVMLADIITYTLHVENHGPSTSTAVTLINTLPAGATLISATQTGSFGSCTGASVITCQWPSLSGLAQVTIVARATAPGTLTNTAIVSGTASDPDSGNNAVTFVTRVNRPPTANAGLDQILSAGASCQAVVTLNGSGSSDPDGDLLTYTWTIDNLLPPPIVLSPMSEPVTGPMPTGPLPLGQHAITLTVNDGHGGTATDTVVVTVRDVTAPTFSGVPAPVTVEQSSSSGAGFTVTTPVAGDNCSGSVTVSNDAPAVFPPGATTVTFTARDAAGNSATATTMVTVVDTVAPALTIASPQTRAYVHSDVVTVTFSATDAGSGLTAGMPTAALDGVAVANAQSISLLTLALGTHSFVVSATDVAGNSRSQTVTFTIIATLDSLIASVNVFAGQNKIDDANTVNSLLRKLSDARQAVQRGKKAAAIDKLQEFIDQLNAQQGRHVTVDAAQTLVADARYVIGTLE